MFTARKKKDSITIASGTKDSGGGDGGGSGSTIAGHFANGAKKALKKHTKFPLLSKKLRPKPCSYPFHSKIHI